MADTGKGRDPIRSVWVHDPRLYKAIDTANAGSTSPVYTFIDDWFFKAASSGNISVTPTGISATGAVGTVITQQTETPTGVAATGAVGTPLPNIQPVVTGISATGAVGTPTLNVSSVISPTGIAAAGAVGSPLVAISVFPTGIAAIGNVGVIIPANDNFPFGVSGTGAVGTVTVTADNTPSTPTVAGWPWDEKKARRRTKRKIRAQELVNEYNRAILEAEAAQLEHVLEPVIREFVEKEAVAETAPEKIFRLPPAQRIDFAAMARSAEANQQFLQAVDKIIRMRQEEEEFAIMLLAAAV